MAYIQHKNPFPATSCGRRRAGGIGSGFNMTEEDSPMQKRLRKTTKGKGRNFRTVKEGAGMTSIIIS